MHLDQRQIDKVVRLFYEIERSEGKGVAAGGSDNV